MMFGASGVPASQIVEAQWAADRRGHGRFRTEQSHTTALTAASRRRSAAHPREGR
jgi:hypothetical protein